MDLLRQIVLRLIACSAITYVLWRMLGNVAFALCAPAYGLAIAKPLYELVALAYYGIKGAALADVQGRYFKYRGIPIDVLDRSDTYRWINTADVRKVIPSFPGDQTLWHMYPADMTKQGEGLPVRIRAERLFATLEKSQNPDTLKFKVWLQREIVLPAAKTRKRSS